LTKLLSQAGGAFFETEYTVSQNNCATIHLFITMTNVGRVWTFFYCCILREICNKTVPYFSPHLRYVAALSCET